MISECKKEIDQINIKLKLLGESVTEVIVPKNEDDYNSDAILELRVVMKHASFVLIRFVHIKI